MWKIHQETVFSRDMKRVDETRSVAILKAIVAEWSAIDNELHFTGTNLPLLVSLCVFILLLHNYTFSLRFG